MVGASRVLLFLLLIGAVPTQAASWLTDSAGRAGYDRCPGLLNTMAEHAIPGDVQGGNPQVASRLPEYRLLGFFINALAGTDVRHTTLVASENQTFDCEGRAVTTYVAKGSCQSFANEHLADSRHMGALGGGLTQVYLNAPYQLYITDLDKGAQCLVTGIRRFARMDEVSACEETDVNGTEVRLCLMWRGPAEPSMFSLRMGGDPVFAIPEYLADRFRFDVRAPASVRGAPLVGDDDRLEVQGGCPIVDSEPDYRRCELHWGSHTLFEGTRFRLR